MLLSCNIFNVSLAILSDQKDKNINKTKINLQESEWAETIAEIYDVTKLPNGNYGYTIRYNTPASIASNQQGEKILGPIDQHVLNAKKEPMDKQKVKIKYMKSEPIIFQLINTIQFKN